MTTLNWKEFKSLMKQAEITTDKQAIYKISSMIYGGEWKFTKQDYLKFLEYQSFNPNMAWNEKLKGMVVKLVIDIDKKKDTDNTSVLDWEGKIRLFIGSTLNELFGVPDLGPTHLIKNTVSNNGKLYCFDIYIKNEHRRLLCAELNNRAPEEISSRFNFDPTVMNRTVFSFKSKKEDGYNVIDRQAGIYKPADTKRLPLLKKYSMFNLGDTEPVIIKPVNPEKWIKSEISEDDRIEIIYSIPYINQSQISALLKILDSNINGQDWYKLVNSLYNLGAECDEIHTWSEKSEKYDAEAEDTINLLESPFNRIPYGKSLIIRLFPETEKIFHKKLEKLPPSPVLEFFDENGQKEVENDYYATKKEFEKYHFLSVEQACFYTIKENKIQVQSERSFCISYRHINYSFTKKGEQCSGVFIKRWLTDENIRKYESVDLYPPGGDICPNNIYNIWRDFKIKSTPKVELSTEEQAKLKTIYGHWRGLCDNDQKSYDYLLNYIAHLFQKPGKKPGTGILFKSAPGCGKELGVFRLLENIIGENYCLITGDSERIIHGNFNSLIKHKLLIAHDEISYSICNKNEESLKTLMTRKMDTITYKGFDSIECQSYSRNLLFSNGDFPLKIAVNDRRYAVFNCTNDKPSTEYFNYLAECVYDNNVLRQLFDELSAKDISNWKPINDIPQTEFLNDIKSLSLSPVENFMIDYIRNLDKSTKIKANELFGLFDDFLARSFTGDKKYSTTSIKFGLYVKNMKIDGFSKIHTMKGAVYAFDKETCYKWLETKGHVEKFLSILHKSD